MSDSLILDTNIIQYGVGKSLNNEVAKLLEEVAREKPKLAISAFTTFEIYRGLDKTKFPVTNELIKKFSLLDVDGYTYKIAAVLYSCYKHHQATKNKGKHDDTTCIFFL